MTDFIHEQHKSENPQSPSSYEPPMDEKTGEQRVFVYIFILFLVAFGLLLWSYFMNRQTTDQVLSELRGNADALQTAITRNIELEKALDATEDELEAARQEIEREKQSVAQGERALAEERERSAARALLWQMEYCRAAGLTDACRDAAEQIKPYVHALQTEGEPSELARYQEIVAALAETEETAG